VAGGVAKSGKVVDYADDVEYGTRHASAQPYMTPAVESEKKEMRNRTVRMFKG
jgi:hypothetical protein